MIEAGILGIFSCFLILSLACGISLIWALLAGFILFFSTDCIAIIRFMKCCIFLLKAFILQKMY